MPSYLLPILEEYPAVMTLSAIWPTWMTQLFIACFVYNYFTPTIAKPSLPNKNDTWQQISSETHACLLIAFKFRLPYAALVVSRWWFLTDEASENSHVIAVSHCSRTTEEQSGLFEENEEEFELHKVGLPLQETLPLRIWNEHMKDGTCIFVQEAEPEELSTESGLLNLELLPNLPPVGGKVRIACNCNRGPLKLSPTLINTQSSNSVISWLRELVSWISLLYTIYSAHIPCREGWYYEESFRFIIVKATIRRPWNWAAQSKSSGASQFLSWGFRRQYMIVIAPLGRNTVGALYTEKFL